MICIIVFFCICFAFVFSIAFFLHLFCICFFKRILFAFVLCLFWNCRFTLHFVLHFFWDAVFNRIFFAFFGCDSSNTSLFYFVCFVPQTGLANLELEFGDPAHECGYLVPFYSWWQFLSPAGLLQLLM